MGTTMIQGAWQKKKKEKKEKREKKEHRVDVVAGASEEPQPARQEDRDRAWITEEEKAATNVQGAWHKKHSLIEEEKDDVEQEVQRNKAEEAEEAAQQPEKPKGMVKIKQKKDETKTNAMEINPADEEEG